MGLLKRVTGWGEVIDLSNFIFGDYIENFIIWGLIIDIFIIDMWDVEYIYKAASEIEMQIIANVIIIKSHPIFLKMD